jgi:serine/threonine protein kinase/tetratricopeptide (TPR) repeat protein
MPTALGPFELRQIIGKGGMGEVWGGVHVSEGEPVAVKVLTRAGARREEYLEAFHNEVRAVAGLNHPHIVIPLDYGEITAEQSLSSRGQLAEGSPYIVMELAVRGSLRRFQTTMRWPHVRAALLVVLEALGHAHAAGIIHRDLKPANILVGCRGPDAGIKLTDFGLARASDSFDQAGSEEIGWGTPQYMAPEQFRGAWRDYGPWTDLYSLGVTAFQLIDGELPFSATSAFGYGQAHTSAPVRRLRPNFEVPAGIEGWIARLMHKSPQERFLCAADAAYALMALPMPPGLDDTPVRTIPEPSEHETPGTLPEHDTERDVPRHAPTTQILVAHTQNERIDFSAKPSSMVNNGEAMEIQFPPMPVSWRPQSITPPSKQLLGAGLGLFGLRTIPLVGREHERDVIWAKLREVRETGQARVVMIRGGAGTGKSRLAEWISRRAHETGSANLMHAIHSGMGNPSDGIGRMMARYTRCLGLRREEIIERAGRGLLSDIDSRAFADFISPSGPEIAMPVRTTLRMSRTDQRYGMLRKFLFDTAGDRPFVMVIDDAQWGGDALMFTQFLLERVETQPVPVLILLTVREESLAFRETETVMLDRVAESDAATTLHLKALTEVEIDRLVRDLLYLDGALADEVEKRSGGNPLFAVQIVGDMVSRGKLQFGPRGFILGPNQTVEIPDDIHALWRSRVFRLVAARPEADMIALEIAAAIGLEVDRQEWMIACELAEITPPLDLVGVLLAEGLAERQPDGWMFSHGLLRESIQRDAEANERWSAVNAACVEMIFRRYPGREFPFHDRVSQHLEYALEPEASLSHRLLAATVRVERSEFDDAKRHLKRFWELAKTLPLPQDDERRGQGYAIEAELHLQQGHLAEALRQAETGTIEARRHKWETLPVALVTQAECLLAQMSLNKAAQLFEKTLEISIHHPRVRARAMLGLGRVRGAQSLFEESVTLMEKAGTIFVAEGDHVGEGRCLNAIGDMMRETRRYREARDFSRAAMEVFERLGHQIGVADCQDDLADLFRAEGQIDRGIEWSVKSIQLYESLGSDESMHARNTLALLLRDGGRPKEALTVLAQVASHHRATRNLQAFAVAALHAVSCHALLNDWDEINEVLVSAREPLKALQIAPHETSRSLQIAFQRATDAAKLQVLRPLQKMHESIDPRAW